jgi:uncharacterized glyoxalase superfamily protein PhnB
MSVDMVTGWAAVYPHICYDDPLAAIAWLTRAFGFRERVRMALPDGAFITSKLATPGGGLVMVAANSDERREWMRERVPDFRQEASRSWPNMTYSTTVMVPDVGVHFARAQAEGAVVLMPPSDLPWGLLAYAALDLEGNQWEFTRVVRTIEPETWGARRVE